MTAEELARRVREELRARGRSESTIEAYAGWIRRWGRSASGSGGWSVEAAERFLERLAAERRYAWSSWVQARCALRFALDAVLGIEAARALAPEVPASGLRQGGTRRERARTAASAEEGRTGSGGRDRRAAPREAGSGAAGDHKGRPYPEIESVPVQKVGSGAAGDHKGRPYPEIESVPVQKVGSGAVGDHKGRPAPEGGLPAPSARESEAGSPGAEAVLSRDEVGRLLATLDPPARLVAALVYGGLRLGEALTLRLGDVEAGAVVVRGQEPRRVPLPRRWRRELAAQVERARQAAAGAANEAWLFPAGRGASGHVHARSVQRALVRAARRSGLAAASSRALRRAGALHLLDAGADEALVRRLLGLSPAAPLRRHRPARRRRRGGVSSALELLGED